MILILMGVSGAGKTTIGELLSRQIGWPFEDGDDFHPEANKLKMASGTPLTDADREPWLQAIHARMVELIGEGKSEIMACSALKESYRELLLNGLAPGAVHFAMLTAPEALIEERLLERHHPFMNPNLLDSQMATLEVPSDAWQISVAGSPEQATKAIEAHLQALVALPKQASGS